jgi:hypothetical protein
MFNRFCLIILIFLALFTASCSSIKAGLYVSIIDRLDGKTFEQNEANVRAFLEGIIESESDYLMEAFGRTAINHRFKRSELMTHSFFVIFVNDSENYTLSYYGTDSALRSRGAWVLNSDDDRDSYEKHIAGNSRIWNSNQLFIGRKIDTRMTIINILARMDSGRTYYYRAHKNNYNSTVDNCNTALLETVVFK